MKFRTYLTAQFSDLNNSSRQGIEIAFHSFPFNYLSYLKTVFYKSAISQIF